jgi:hypothetical protein
MTSKWAEYVSKIAVLKLDEYVDFPALSNDLATLNRMRCAMYQNRCTGDIRILVRRMPQPLNSLRPTNLGVRVTCVGTWGTATTPSVKSSKKYSNWVRPVYDGKGMQPVELKPEVTLEAKSESVPCRIKACPRMAVVNGLCGYCEFWNNQPSSIVSSCLSKEVMGTNW